MTSPSDLTGAPAAPLILPPYTPDHDTKARRGARRWVTGLVIVFCLFQGLAFAFLAPFLLPAFGAPIAILGALVIWALPGVRTAPIRTVERLFFIVLVVSIGWPNYLGLALPGLPWITMARITGIPLTIIFLACVSMSEDFRARLGASLSGAPLVWRLLAAFVVIQLVSIAFSNQPFFSLDKFITAQMNWTAMFFLSAYIFTLPGMVERWAAIMWIMALFVGVIGVWEWRLGHVVWLGHIPSFLQIQDPTVLATLEPRMRRYTTIYRVQSTFSGPIQLGEFLALVYPFLFHFLMTARQMSVRVAAALSIPFLVFVTLISNARSGAVGLLVDVLLYTLFWGAMRWKHRPGKMLGPTIVFAYPAIAGVAAIAVLFVGRIHRIVLGGAETQGSTDARKEQFALGIPKIIHHPWGYGIGKGAEALGWFSPGGDLSIDTYYLSIALEYGVIGFIIYYGMFAWALFRAAETTLKDPGGDRETSFLAPAAIALCAFIVIKSALSQQDNHYLVFMILGMVVALLHRIQAQTGAVARRPRARSRYASDWAPAFMG
jgi:hypothetical protein